MNTEQILENEKTHLLEALGNCLELNREFLNKTMGKDNRVKDLLLMLPESEREFACQVAIDEDGCSFQSGMIPLNFADMFLDVGEIEEDPAYIDEDDLSDWYVNDAGYAYYEVGFLCIRFDVAKLEDYVIDNMLF